MRVILLVTCLLVCPSLVVAQQARADQIAAAFTKQKHSVTVKRGVEREKYKDVQAQPAVVENVKDLAGRYASDVGGWIDIEVGDDGRIRATGSVELKDVTLAGAVLTATQVYRDGTTEPFEAVFLNRITRKSPTDPGDRAFGLGVLLGRPVHVDGNTFDKLFFERDR